LSNGEEFKERIFDRTLRGREILGNLIHDGQINQHKTMRMKRSGKMRITGIIMIALIVFVGNVWADNWVYVERSLEGDVFIDTDSIQIRPLRCWVKTVWHTPQPIVDGAIKTIKAFHEWNCRERSYVTLPVVFYDPADRPISHSGRSDVQYVAPGSIMEIIFESICKLSTIKR